MDEQRHDGTIGSVARAIPSSMAGLQGALLVCGTASDVGKTVVVAGLCRLLSRNGVRVAPFKAQNMALNSAVTASGHEIGRAQALQAHAAGITAEVACNPILLKPTGERAAQVVVMGRPIGTMTAAEYHAHKPHLRAVVLDALADLRARFDVVLGEGAGSACEPNLLDGDLVNLPLADAAGIDAVVVGDIDRGGVFAALHGTVDLLPPHLRRRVRGLLINRFRGDPALLGDATEVLARACGVPTLGVLPMLAGLGLDAEDSLFLERGAWAAAGGAAADGLAVLDVAVLALPYLANATDIDPLAAEAAVSVRLVGDVGRLGQPDLVIIPGSKHTVHDLAWLRARGFEPALRRLVAGGRTVVLGICGGYQALGTRIEDRVESGAGEVTGLGLLPVRTTFEADKVVRRATGAALGERLDGYQLHHGRVRAEAGAGGGDGPGDGGRGAGTAGGAGHRGTAEVWLRVAGQADGVRVGAVWGTTVHGLFEADGFRRAFLGEVAAVAGRRLPASTLRFAGHRDASLDRMADAIEQHCDLARLTDLIAGAGPNRRPTRPAPAHGEPMANRRAHTPSESTANRPGPGPAHGESTSIRHDTIRNTPPPRHTIPNGRVLTGTVPAPGEHGGDGARLAAALGVDPAAIIDLSASLNPFAPDAAAVLAGLLRRRPDAIGAYPDPAPATAALAAALDVDPARLVLTNGGAEAIALVAALEGEGDVRDPEFSLYRRHLPRVRVGAARWRSNPSNPLGRLAASNDTARVWDEAFFPLATGRWTRGDDDAWRLGSLTKLWACPGLRLGYAIAPTAELAGRLAHAQPRWSVNGLALAALPELLAATDLPGWRASIVERRAELSKELAGLGYRVHATEVNWVLVQRPGLRAAMATHGVAVRDCTSFGLPGTARVALPRSEHLDRVLSAFAAIDPRGQGA